MDEIPPLRLSCTVNGRKVTDHVPAQLTLADFLRDRLGLTGTHLGCEEGVCGACTALADGALIRTCLMLAVQAEGMSIETVEGAAASGRIADLQEAFFCRAAVQCGFCSGGMLLTAAALLETDADPTRDRIRSALTGNICRCTGYQAIVDAIAAVAEERGRGT